MSIGVDLKTYLLGYAGVAALVVKRIYRTRAPISITPKAPYVVIAQVFPGRQYAHDGPIGLSFPRWQVTGFAATPEECDALVAQIIAAMEAWPLTGTVQSTELLGAPELYDKEAELYYVATDWRIAYPE